MGRRTSKHFYQLPDPSLVIRTYRPPYSPRYPHLLLPVWCPSFLCLGSEPQNIDLKPSVTVMVLKWILRWLRLQRCQQLVDRKGRADTGPYQRAAHWGMVTSLMSKSDRAIDSEGREMSSSLTQDGLQLLSLRSKSGSRIFYSNSGTGTTNSPALRWVRSGRESCKNSRDVFPLVLRNHSRWNVPYRYRWE